MEETLVITIVLRFRLKCCQSPILVDKGINTIEIYLYRKNITPHKSVFIFCIDVSGWTEDELC